MSAPNHLDRLWCILVGVVLGGAAGFAVACVLVVIMVSGGGAAQGIADLDVSPVFIFFGSIGILVGNFLGVLAWVKREKKS